MSASRFWRKSSNKKVNIDEVVSDVRNYVLSGSRSPKKISDAVYSVISQLDTLGRDEIIRQIDNVFKKTKRIDSDGNPAWKKHKVTSERIKELKQALIKRFKGGKEENWKDVLLGISGYSREVSKYSLSVAVDVEDKTAVISSDDKKRFVDVIPAKADEVALSVRAGSTYAGRQGLEKECRHTEDAIEVGRSGAETSLKLPNGMKITAITVADGLGSHTDAMDSKCNARAAHFASKHLNRLVLAFTRSNPSPESLKEALPTIMQRVREETLLKRAPKGEDIIIGDAAIATAVVFTNREGESKAVVASLGDCMVCTYNKETGNWNTIAAAKQFYAMKRGSPEGVTSTRGDIAESVYVAEVPLNRSELVVVMSDGVFDALPTREQGYLPVEYIKEKYADVIRQAIAKAPADQQEEAFNATAADMARRIAPIPADEREELLSTHGGEVMAVIDEEEIKGVILLGTSSRGNVVSARSLAGAIHAAAVKGSEAMRQDALNKDDIRGVGDDYSLVVYDPSIPSDRSRSAAASSSAAR